MKRLLATILAFVSLTTFAMAQQEDRADTTFKLGEKWLMELDPDDQPYPDYLADPRRCRMQVGIGFADSELPSTSSDTVTSPLTWVTSISRPPAAGASIIPGKTWRSG